MIKKVITVITLASFLMSSTGCSKLVKIDLTNKPTIKNEKKESISSLVLNDGTQIDLERYPDEFRYYKRLKIIAGVESNGKPMSIPIKSVNLITVKSTVDTIETIQTLEKKDFERQNKFSSNEPASINRIARLTTIYGDVYKFSGYGAIIDYKRNEIIGHVNSSLSQNTIIVPFDDILCAEVKKVDAVKTVATITTTGLFLVTIGFLIALSSWDLNINMGGGGY